MCRVCLKRPEIPEERYGRCEACAKAGRIATRVESCHDTTVAAPTVATRRPTEAPFPGVAPTVTVIKRVASTVPSRATTTPRAACTATPVLVPHGADTVPVTPGMRVARFTAS